MSTSSSNSAPSSTSSHSPNPEAASDRGGANPIVAELYLGTGIANASLRLETSAGMTLATGTTNRDGVVFLSVEDVPKELRAVATVPGSDEEFSAEIRGARARISLITTLASRYRQGHPDVSLEEAEDRIKQALDLPADIWVDGLVEGNVLHSDIAVWRAASESGGWKAYSQEILNRAEDGRSVAHRLSRDQLSRRISGLESGLADVAELARTRLQSRLGIPDAEGDESERRYPPISLVNGPESLAGQFLLGIGTGLGGNLVTAGVNAVIGWAANQMGLNYGTAGQLQEIENQLNVLTTDINNLIRTITDETLKEEIDALNDDLAPVQSANSNLMTGLSDFVTSGPTMDTPFSPPVTFSNLVTDINAPDYPTLLTTVNNALLGPNEIIMEATDIRMNQELGIDTPSRMQSVAWRTNHAFLPMANLYAYYAGQQTFALNLYAEEAHNYLLNPNPVDGVAAMTPNLRTAISALKAQRQQVPLFVSPWGFLVDFENGVMWWENMQGPDTWDNANSAANSFSRTVTLPDGSSVTYDDWRLPTYGEMVTLQNRGKYCPSYNSSVPHHSDKSYPDTGQATCGLPALGFQNVQTALENAPDDNGNNGDLWMLFYQGAGSPVLPNYEFRLNHASENNSPKGSSDTNAYLFCRTFGPDTLVTPYFFPSDNPAPTSVQGKDFATGEYALWGVPTSIDLSTTDAPSTVSYPSPSDPSTNDSLDIPENSIEVVAAITYEISLGGDYTLGNGSTAAASTPAKTHTKSVSTADLGTGVPNELRQLVNWTSSDPKTLNMLNLPYLSGIGIPLGTSQVTLGASLLNGAGKAVEGTLDYTPNAAAPKTLTSIQISPRNQIYGANSLQPANGSFPYYCTGFYSDGTLETLGTEVTWSVPDNDANAQMVVTGSGVSLEMNQPPQTTSTPYEVTITATYEGATDSTTIQIVPPVDSET